MAKIKKEMKGSATLKKQAHGDEPAKSAIGPPRASSALKKTAEEKEKKVKGGPSHTGPESEEERLLRLEMAQLKLEEQQKAKEENMKALLKERYVEEEKLSRINRAKVNTRWREIMRNAKLQELKDDIEIVAQNHEREVDRKNAIIQLLDKDLEEAEEQYQMALRSHFHNVDALIDLHNARLSQLEADFQSDLSGLQSEFLTEREDIISKHEKEKEDMLVVMGAMESKYGAEENTEEHSFTQLRDEIKNKNSEEFSALRITLEGQIDDLERHFENAHQNYINSTEQRTNTFKMLTLKDQQSARTIELQLRKLQRLQENIGHWKTKMANNVRECEERNSALREEKEAVGVHYQELKARMGRFRQAQSKRLAELSVLSNQCIKTLEDKKRKAEQILRLAEMCRGLETEQEKIMPFLPEHTAELAELPDDEAPSIENHTILRNFYRRYNKVKLDELVLEREQQALSQENKELRRILKQYLDGISVSPETLNNNNTLFVVNGRTNAPPLSHEPQNITVVEAATTVNRAGSIRQ